MFFALSSRRRHTRFSRDWSSDVCSSDLARSRDRSCATFASPTKSICVVERGKEVQPLAFPAFARWTWMSEKTTFRCCQLSGVALTAILMVPVAYVASDATAMMASSAATAKANARRDVTAVFLREHDSPGELYR